MEICITVAGESKRSEAWLLNDNPQFLLQLSYQRFLGPFAIVHLAAGKLPKSCHRLAGRPLRQQDATVSINKSASRDKDDLHAQKNLGSNIAYRVNELLSRVVKSAGYPARLLLVFTLCLPSNQG